MSSDFKGRREDQRLVTGAGRYTADWNLPGQAHAAFLRSDRAHARIVSVDTSAARALPGVVGVLTGADMMAAGYKGPLPLNPGPGVGGTTLLNPPRSALAHDRVRFAGEPVALVVAETEAIAYDACELITVEYQDLPVLVTAAEAVAPGAIALHDSVPGNLAIAYEYGEAAPTDAALAGAAHIVQINLDAQRISGNPMEPKACLVAYDSGTDSFDVYMQTQGMADILSALAHVTGHPKDRFRIHAHDVGGAFGVRNELYPENTATVLAARTFGRPVKWVGTRSESIVSDHHARAAELSGTLGLDKDGNFLGLRVEWLVNLGAFCSNAGPLINTVASPRSMASNIYKLPAVYGHHRLIFTNTTPATAYRGAGRPNVAYLWERLVEEAARVTGIDHIELRRRNLIPKDAFPYKTASGSTYDSGDPPGLLSEILDTSGFKSFPKRRAEAKSRGKLRGLGFAMFIEPSGAVGKEEIAIKFGPDGDISLFTLAGPSGQGYETVYSDIVAKTLGVNPDTIAVRSSDPTGPTLTAGTGSFGSRSLISHGSALFKGAQEVVTKGAELAAQHLEVATSDVVFDKGRYSVRGTDLSVSFADLARKHANSGAHPLDTTLDTPVAAAFPSGAHVSEVEIDPDTGEVQIISYIAVDDCGVIYNHTIVEGQLHGGLMQGIGQVMGEHIIYDPDTGQLLTGSFMDYFMPKADILPKITLADRPVPSPANPLGAKGAGEAGATGSVPCLANAVHDALAAVGVKHIEMPYTPARIWTAIRQAQA